MQPERVVIARVSAIIAAVVATTIVIAVVVAARRWGLRECNTRKFHHNKILLATWFSFNF
jgi:heme/copper-type cytochrome/quinol oxidase subunit 2